jgi:putative MATE family efflux protein
MNGESSPVEAQRAGLIRLGTAWRLFVRAVIGVPCDCTEGPVRQAVILLGIPMILEMAMESVFAVTDILFVGHLGPSAVSTIGLAESLLMLVYTVSTGLGIGATAMVARRVGERDSEGAAHTAVQAVALGACLSVVIAAVGVSFAPALLELMGGSPEVIREGTPYVRVMFAGNAVIVLLYLGNALARGCGDGTIAMRALILANGLNLLLVPCLVHGFGFLPKLGVTGAACATTLARGVGAVYTLWQLAGAKCRMRIMAHHLALHPEVMLRMVKLSGSGMLQAFIGMASWIGVVRVISHFGSEALAGYTIAMRMVLFAIFPAFGLANAAATMVGQSLGAGKPERGEKAVWMAGLYNAFFLSGMGILFLLFAPAIIGWVSPDPEVDGYAIACLRTVTCGFPLYAFGMVLTQAFNGAGDTWTPTVIHCFVFWVFEIPAAYLLSSVLNLGPQGVFLAITLAFSSLAVASALLFERGGWKTKQV